MRRNTAMLGARHQLLISEDVSRTETSMKREISGNRPWRVIIVGGGFGGLRAAQTLKYDWLDNSLVHLRRLLRSKIQKGMEGSTPVAPAGFST